MTKDDWLETRHEMRASETWDTRSTSTDLRVEPMRAPALAGTESRWTVESRGTVYRLHRDEVQVLHAAGTFRTVALQDLTRDQPDARARAAHLRRRGLVTVNGYCPREDTVTRFLVISLSRRGQHVLTAADPRGHYRAGPRRWREVGHDVGVYRAYQHECRRLWGDGCAVTTLRTEDELKRLLWGSRSTESPRDPHERRWARAAELVLPVDAAGCVQIPDLQIGYRDARGEPHIVNVEVTTRQYTDAQRQAKLRAGFRCYAVAALMRDRP